MEHRGQNSAIVLANGVRRNNYSARERRDIGEKLLTARNRGIKLHEAVVEYGISERTGIRYINETIDSRVVPTVDAYRKQQNDLLDETQQKIADQYDIARELGARGIETQNATLLEKAAAIRATAIGLQLRLDDRRAKLNGLDAPIRVDAVVTTQDVADAELQQMIRETQQKIREASGGGA